MLINFYNVLLTFVFFIVTDGIFIGNAFLLCSRSLGWTIIATTVYHELAQEIADYALLVHHCGLSRRTALAANFLSGLSVMFGAILILTLDLAEEGMGLIMAVSAGVYLFICASECIPRVQATRKTANDTLIFLVCFIMGAVPIGLVLLNHGHCEAEH
jgi:zinc transporter ZupT